MPHAEPLDKTNAPHEVHDLLTGIEEKFGHLPNIFGTMAHHPDLLTGVVSIDTSLQTSLPGRLRELAYFKASQINCCEYCSHYHAKAAIKTGLSADQLRATENYADSDLFSATEKAVLKYAEQLTVESRVSKETVDEVKKHIGDSELVALAATVALANFTNRFNHGLDIQLP